MTTPNANEKKESTKRGPKGSDEKNGGSEQSARRQKQIEASRALDPDFDKKSEAQKTQQQKEI